MPLATPEQQAAYDAANHQVCANCHRSFTSDKSCLCGMNLTADHPGLREYIEKTHVFAVQLYARGEGKPIPTDDEVTDTIRAGRQKLQDALAAIGNIGV